MSLHCVIITSSLFYIIPLHYVIITSSYHPSACITAVVCSQKNLKLLFKQAESCPSLRLIVKMGDVTEEEKEQAEKIGLTLVTMEEVEVSGRSLGAGSVVFVDHFPPFLQKRGRESPAEPVVS